jgi:hypothetical protein
MMAIYWLRVLAIGAACFVLGVAAGYNFHQDTAYVELNNDGSLRAVVGATIKFPPSVTDITFPGRGLCVASLEYAKACE